MKSLLLSICCITSLAVSSLAVEKPNILFILCDDLGPGDLGVLWQNQREGKQLFSTPQLDQFAKEGMILSRHYAPAPVCAPSRGSLLTGRHQGNCAIRDNQFDKELPDEHTLGSVLQQAGYKTAIIGKWGLQGGIVKKGTRGDRSKQLEPSHPLERGFDYFYGYTAHVDGHFQYPHEGNRPCFDGYTDVTDKLEKCYSTDLFTARTKKWITEHVKENPDQPFFAYLSYTAPHAGLRVPTTSHLTKSSNYPKGGGLKGGVQWNDDSSNGQINTAAGEYDKGIHPLVAKSVGDDGKSWPNYAQRHVSMVKRIDDSVADLVHLLKDLEIDDNTLIVFTSDNGTHQEGGADGCGKYNPRYLGTYGPFDGIKRDLWEGGVRMPTLVRWPAKVKANSRSNHPSQFHDWMATFCEMAGVSAPALSDGVSIVPTLTGQSQPKGGVVYIEYAVGGSTPKYEDFEKGRRGQKHGQMQSILIGDFKGVRTNISGNDTEFEVYHTLKDPKETKNLAGKRGVPSQEEFETAVVRLRRPSTSAKRPYDKQLIPASADKLKRSAVVHHKLVDQQFAWVPQADGLEGETQMLKSIAAQEHDGLQVFSSYLYAPADGEYDFSLKANGKAVVRLHQAVLIDADINYTSGAAAKSGSIYLKKGAHPLRVSYLTGEGNPMLELKWKTPDAAMQPIPTTNLGLIK